MSTSTPTAPRRSKRVSVPMPPTLDEAIGPAPDRVRVVVDLQALRAEASRLRAVYSGGLAAERQSAAALRATRKRDRRALVAGTRGRPIDLKALLRQRDSAGLPVWALADPTKPLRADNGGVDRDGVTTIAEAGPDLNGYWSKCFVGSGRSLATGFAPSGLPALPGRVRQIVTDPRVRHRALFVGVLFQPTGWEAVNPDPAIIVKWKDTPAGVYHCLAVWGADKPTLMEFVD